MKNRLKKYWQDDLMLYQITEDTKKSPAPEETGDIFCTDADISEIELLLFRPFCFVSDSSRLDNSLVGLNHSIIGLNDVLTDLRESLYRRVEITDALSKIV